MQPDPKKIQGINKLIAPNDKQQLVIPWDGDMCGDLYTPSLTLHWATEAIVEEGYAFLLGQTN